MQGTENLLADYYGHRIKRYILGQTLTTEAAATGLGSGVSEAHIDTFMQIVKYDTTNLEESITTDLVTPLKDWNFKEACPHLHWADTPISLSDWPKLHR